METDQNKWRIWADFLETWGIRELVASFLVSSGPFTTIGAQLIYFAQPFLPQSQIKQHLNELTMLLEDQTQIQAFTEYLSEDYMQ